MVNIMLIPLLYCVKKECDGNGGELYICVGKGSATLG